MNNEKPEGLIKDIIKMINARTKDSTVKVPTDSWDSINKRIQDYVYIMGRKNKLIPKETKKEDLTFDQVYDVLSAMFGDKNTNSIHERLRPHIRSALFSQMSGETKFFKPKAKDDE